MVPSFQRMIELRSPRALKIGNRMLRPRYCTYRKTMVTTTRKTGSNLLSSPNRGASLSKYLLQAGAKVELRTHMQTLQSRCCCSLCLERMDVSIPWSHQLQLRRGLGQCCLHLQSKFPQDHWQLPLKGLIIEITLSPKISATWRQMKNKTSS